MTKKQKRSRPEPSVVHFELSDEELEHVSSAMSTVSTAASTSISTSVSISAHFGGASDKLAALRVP
jgi:hypothetical protein